MDKFLSFFCCLFLFFSFLAFTNLTSEDTHGRAILMRSETCKLLGLRHISDALCIAIREVKAIRLHTVVMAYQRAYVL